MSKQVSIDDVAVGGMTISDLKAIENNTFQDKFDTIDKTICISTQLLEESKEFQQSMMNNIDKYHVEMIEHQESIKNSLIDTSNNVINHFMDNIIEYRHEIVTGFELVDKNQEIIISSLKLIELYLQGSATKDAEKIELMKKIFVVLTLIPALVVPLIITLILLL